MVTISIGYLFIQIHFMQMIRYTQGQILKKNQIRTNQRRDQELLKNIQLEMSNTRSLNKSNSKSNGKLRLEELE